MPKFYLKQETIKKYENNFKSSYLKNEPLAVKEISNGIIFPIEENPKSKTGFFEAFGGVCDENFNFIQLSLLERRKAPDMVEDFPVWYIGANPKYTKEDIEYIDEDVVFIAAWYDHFGHALGENISRLWYLMKNDKPNYKYAIIVHEDWEDLPHGEFLDLFGIDKTRIIIIKKPTQFKKVIVPEQSIRYHDYYTKEYLETMDKIKENVHGIRFNTIKKIYRAKGKYPFFKLFLIWLKIVFNINNPLKKIYMSKKGIDNNRGIGEDLIEEIFLENGFTSIPTHICLSPKETIEVCKQANIMAAQSASCAHNAIFQNKGTKTIVLNRSYHIHPLQTMIDKMNNMNTTYIDCYFIPLETNWSSGPFYLYLTDELKAFFRDNHFKVHNKNKFIEEFDKYIKIYADCYIKNAQDITCMSYYRQNLSVDDIIKYARKIITCQ